MPNFNTAVNWPPAGGLPPVDTDSIPSIGWPAAPQPEQANGLVVVANLGLAVANSSTATAWGTTEMQVSADGRPAGYNTEPLNLQYTWLSGALSGAAVLDLSASPLSVGSTFTQADLDGALLDFDADVGAQSDVIVFQVEDLRHGGVLSVSVTFASS